jgi:hypothetical protein
MPTPVGPPGTLLGSGRGTGTGVVIVSHSLPKNGTEVTLRITCLGTGKVWITDQTGGEILGTAGCGKGVVYSSGWKKTSHDGRVIHVEVSPATVWAVDLWEGNPPVKVQGPLGA